MNQRYLEIMEQITELFQQLPSGAQIYLLAVLAEDNDLDAEEEDDDA